MATSRSRGGKWFTRRPAIWISPAVGYSRPAIMRRVVVLPQPEGPSRHTTSPASTLRSTRSTAVRSPNTLDTWSSAIVDMGLPLDRAEGNAAQQMVLQQEGDEEDRHQEQRFDRRQETPAHADIATDCLRHGDRHGAGLDAGHQQGEQELVPRQDQSEHRGRRQAGFHLRQANLEEYAALGAAVEPRRVLDLT